MSTSIDPKLSRLDQYKKDAIKRNLTDLSREELEHIAFYYMAVNVGMERVAPRMAMNVAGSLILNMYTAKEGDQLIEALDKFQTLNDKSMKDFTESN